MQLALDLLHRVKAHADHDQHSGATEREVLIVPLGELKKQFGRTAMMPRYNEPGSVIRERTNCRYSAVGRPGRMPGMNPPYFFMSSATSTGLKVIADVEIGEEDDQREVGDAGRRTTPVDQVVVEPRESLVAALLVQLAEQLRDVSSDDAKITGITPAWLTFSGR